MNDAPRLSYFTNQSLSIISCYQPCLCHYLCGFAQITSLWISVSYNEDIGQDGLEDSFQFESQPTAPSYLYHHFEGCKSSSDASTFHTQHLHIQQEAPGLLLPGVFPILLSPPSLLSPSLGKFSQEAGCGQQELAFIFWVALVPKSKSIAQKM